jgi:D-alanyl-lipoteichoic acid acyltransferase DltB (MBOAT superfamily)
MAFVPVYIFILFTTIIVDYVAGILIHKTSGLKRRVILIVTVILNILILCIFKYYNFFLEQTAVFLSGMGIRYSELPFIDILLPIGLSFHTFQALSYIFEINRGNIKPEKHFGIYSLYVMFFPQLVAGPIERPQNMLHQFHEEKHFDSNRVIVGLKIMLWGFIMKLVIADRLGMYVDEVYADAYQTGNLNIWLAVMLFFPFQIYCDFAGYSLIAVGSARVLGFNLMENFRTPFSSLTTSELWNRWHISLSSWFRDYLYQPIVIFLRDYGKWSVVLGLFITFFLSGLWHGAGLAFIGYGLFQGTIMIVEYLLGVKSSKLVKQRFGKLKGILITYFFFSLSLVLFRSLGLRKTGHIFEEMFGKFDFHFVDIPKISSLSYIIGISAIAGLLLFEKFRGMRLLYQNYGLRYEIVITSSMMILLVLFGVFYNVSFIYFQF